MSADVYEAVCECGKTVKLAGLCGFCPHCGRLLEVEFWQVHRSLRNRRRGSARIRALVIMAALIMAALLAGSLFGSAMGWLSSLLPSGFPSDYYPVPVERMNTP